MNSHVTAKNANVFKFAVPTARAHAGSTEYCVEGLQCLTMTIYEPGPQTNVHYIMFLIN